MPVSTQDAILHATKMTPSLFRPAFPVLASTPADAPGIKTLLRTFSMRAHPEGGYFAETDRDPLLVPSPFPPTPASSAPFPARPGFDAGVRNASTSIYYLLTPASPQGHFHRNRGRTVHTLHRGRGRYVVLHADQPGCPIETFVVGPDVVNGERLQWIVEGGKFKASFLLPDKESEESSEGLLISETVVPGFEFFDHDFLAREDLLRLVGEEKARDLEWLVGE